MSPVKQYLRHAAECREMGKTLTPFYREQLEKMAKAWEELARMHEQQLKSFNQRMGIDLSAEQPPPEEEQK